MTGSRLGTGRGFLIQALLTLLLGIQSLLPGPREEGVELSVGEALLKVKVADTPEELARGLSRVSFLPENEGLLSVLPEGQRPSFHMKGVRFPLSIAFLDKSGVIQGFKELELGNDIFYPSHPDARYALEVRRGWFRKHGVEEGDLVRPKFSTLSHAYRLNAGGE
jgi:uncharacterized membrane protein (UPF0127 family)